MTLYRSSFPSLSVSLTNLTHSRGVQDNFPRAKILLALRLISFAPHLLSYFYRGRLGIFLGGYENVHSFGAPCLLS